MVSTFFAKAVVQSSILEGSSFFYTHFYTQDPATGEATDFDWDSPRETFKCVESINLVLGGSDSNSKYLNHVEILAPDMKCHHEKIDPLPVKVI